MPYVWIGKFKLWHKESLALQASKGLNAYALAYYLNVFNEDDEAYIARVAIFEGPDKDKFRKRFVADPRVRVLREEGDQLFYAFKASEISHSIGLDRNVFFVKPVLIKDGFEYWTLASWDKKHLTNVYNRLRSLGDNAKVELISLKQDSLNLFLPHVFAQLTQLQKKALDIAVEEGYFEYPRKMSLEQIAKKYGLARTTFQSHLRKAEKKIITAVTEQTRF